VPLAVKVRALIEAEVPLPTDQTTAKPPEAVPTTSETLAPEAMGTAAPICLPVASKIEAAKEPVCSTITTKPPPASFALAVIFGYWSISAPSPNISLATKRILTPNSYTADTLII